MYLKNKLNVFVVIFVRKIILHFVVSKRYETILRYSYKRVNLH